MHSEPTQTLAQELSSMQSLKAFLARFRRLSIGHKINRPLDAGLEERGKHEVGGFEG